MSFFENDLHQSGNGKMKVLPKRNVTFPFHGCVRGSVLWVHPNKEAVKSFQVPGCVLFVTSVAFLNYTNNRFDQLTCEITGLVC